ncbi:MAG: hypothetical protein HYY17_05100 [Planctomycetes bacterium]|nr:hypothetical protein [Planctomycetota bacterium]
MNLVLMLSAFGAIPMVQDDEPRKKDWSRYFPTGEGISWTYTSDSGREYKRSVRKAEKIGGEQSWIISGFGPGFFYERATVTVGTGGVWLHRFPNVNGVDWLRFPLKIDASWTVQVGMKDWSMRFDMKVEAEEKLKIGETTYSCIRVRTSWQDTDGDSGVLHVWYAEDVGPVRFQNGQTRKNGRFTEETWTLKSFKNGK